MKTNKITLLFSVLAISAFTFSNCADLAVENETDITTESFFSNEDNLPLLLKGGFQDWATSVVSSYSTHPDLISDQITSTNNVRNFWDFAEEPRIRLANTTSYAGATSWEVYYGGFNTGINIANIFISNELTSPSILAQAYFLRGLSRGYLGMFFDQAYLIDENFAVGEDTPEFRPYGDLIDAAIADFDQAISLASANAADFTFNSMPNDTESWTAAEFQDIVNSYAARVLAGEARTAAEAANTDWNAVLTYAQNGIGGPNAQSTLGVFSNSNVGGNGDFANYYMDWSNFIVSCGATVDSCSGYLPADVKVVHSMDPTYPTTYPTDQANGTTADLAAATSTDPRLDGYYVYTNNAGFLRSTRNPNLYSNYFSGRMYSGNDWWQAENDVVLFTDTENQLLIAEAQVMLGNRPGAALTLNNSAAGTGETTLGFDLYSETNGIIADGTLSGGWNLLGTENVATFQFSLMREYAVEVSNFGGGGVNWVFMRRHDLLQEGSMTHFPVPGAQLEILGLDIYTFGGVSNAGTAGTAAGPGWPALAASADGLKIVAKKSVATERAPVNTSDVMETNAASKGASNQ